MPQESCKALYTCLDEYIPHEQGFTIICNLSLGGKHHRFKRGYKNVIDEAIRLVRFLSLSIIFLTLPNLIHSQAYYALVF